MVSEGSGHGPLEPLHLGDVERQSFAVERTLENTAVHPWQWEAEAGGPEPGVPCPLQGTPQCQNVLTLRRVALALLATALGSRSASPQLLLSGWLCCSSAPADQLTGPITQVGAQRAGVDCEVKVHRSQAVTALSVGLQSMWHVALLTTLSKVVLESGSADRSQCRCSSTGEKRV